MNLHTTPNNQILFLKYTSVLPAITKMLLGAIALFFHLPVLATDDFVTERDCIPVSKWYSPSLDKVVDQSKLLDKISTHKVILLGEHHENIQHHRWQLQVIKDLYSRQKNMNLGFEMFPRRLQSVLDAWVNGKLSEREFLSKVDWDSLWSFDVSYYLPIFHFAKDNHIPMVALNVDRELIDAVRNKGWDTIPKEQREGLSNPAAPSRDYLRVLAASYLQHGTSLNSASDTSTSERERFYHFVQGQLLWDRAMAEGIANIVRREDKPFFVAMMGSWHIINHFGVPHQLADLGINDTVVLVPWDSHLDCKSVSPRFADAIFGTPEP